MSRAYTGRDLEVFWGREANWKDGIAGIHQAFNPMAKVPIPKPTYRHAHVKTAERLENAISYTELLEPGEKDFETYYRDPFIMACAFNHKTCTYVGGTGTVNFDNGGAHGDHDSIWMQYHKEDHHGANNIDRTLIGGELTSYGWKCEKGGVLMESFGAKFADIDLAPGAIPMLANNNYHNGAFGASGGWAAYDSNTPQAKHASDLNITWNGAGGSIAGIDIESFDFKLTTPKEHAHVLSSLVAGVHWDSGADFECDVTGFLESLEELEEVERAWHDQTPGTIRIYSDTTVGEEKYIQFTEAYIDSFDTYDIPSASEPIKITMTLIGGAGTRASYHGVFVEGATPCNQITT